MWPDVHDILPELLVMYHDVQAVMLPSLCVSPSLIAYCLSIDEGKTLDRVITPSVFLNIGTASLHGCCRLH